MDRLNQINTLLKEDPDQAFLHFAKAKELEKAGKLDEAKVSYEYLFSNHSDYVGNYYHFGKLLEELGDEERALKIYVLGMDVCKKQNDLHALSELQNVKTNLELGL